MCGTCVESCSDPLVNPAVCGAKCEWADQDALGSTDFPPPTTFEVQACNNADFDATSGLNVISVTYQRCDTPRIIEVNATTGTYTIGPIEKTDPLFAKLSCSGNVVTISSEVDISYNTTGGTVELQSVHASCSVPLYVGQWFGNVELTGYCIEQNKDGTEFCNGQPASTCPTI